MTNTHNIAGAPVVSVIMANYNGAAHIVAALNSVLAQSISNIEVIVADDASTDASVSIVRDVMATDARVRVLQSDINTGPGAARNRALAIATGRWLAVVDADDILSGDRFERLIEMAEEMSADAVADDLTFFDESITAPTRTLLGAAAPELPVRVTPEMLILSDTRVGAAAPLGYLKPVFRRKIVATLRYREDITIGEDHDFLMRFLLAGGNLHLTGKSFYHYRRHENSTSHRLTPDDLAAMIRAQEDILIQHPNMPPELLNSFEERERALTRSMAFEMLVEKIKLHQLTAALVMIARKPVILAALLRATREHFLNRRRDISRDQLAGQRNFEVAEDA